MTDNAPAALGWPLQAGCDSTGLQPPASAEPGPEELDDLPMAVALRGELAAVASRETERTVTGAPPVPSQVSRETEPVAMADSDDDPPLVDTITDPAALVAPGRAERWPVPTRQRVLGVANQKGGVGKTTSTVNLAAALAQHGARVLVIDLDPQGNASTAFGVDHRGGTPSVYDVLVDGRALHEVAVPVSDLPGLFCAPATIDLAGAEIELVSMVARESRLRRAVEALPEQFDFVFVDCPPSLGLLTVNALVAAQEVLIPIQCEFYALEGLSQLLRNIDLVRAHLNPDLHVSTILLTMYDGRTRLAEQVAQEVRTHFGDLVLGSTIPRSVRISEAPGYGQTVMTYDPASRGAIAYVDAARQIAQRSAAEIGGAPSAERSTE
jgi:chromosome partitioning protein